MSIGGSIAEVILKALLSKFVGDAVGGPLDKFLDVFGLAQQGEKIDKILAELKTIEGDLDTIQRTLNTIAKGINQIEEQITDSEFQRLVADYESNRVVIDENFTSMNDALVGITSTDDTT